MRPRAISWLYSTRRAYYRRAVERLRADGNSRQIWSTVQNWVEAYLQEAAFQEVNRAFLGLPPMGDE